MEKIIKSREILESIKAELEKLEQKIAEFSPYNLSESFIPIDLCASTAMTLQKLSAYEESLFEKLGEFSEAPAASIADAEQILKEAEAELERKVLIKKFSGIKTNNPKYESLIEQLRTAAVADDLTSPERTIAEMLVSDLLNNTTEMSKNELVENSNYYKLAFAFNRNELYYNLPDDDPDGGNTAPESLEPTTPQEPENSDNSQGESTENEPPPDPYSAENHKNEVFLDIDLSRDEDFSDDEEFNLDLSLSLNEDKAETSAEGDENVGVEHLNSESDENVSVESLNADSGENVGVENSSATSSENVGVENLTADSGENVGVENLNAEGSEISGVENLTAESGENVDVENSSAEGSENVGAENLTAESGEISDAENLTADGSENSGVENFTAEKNSPAENEVKISEEIQPIVDEYKDDFAENPNELALNISQSPEVNTKHNVTEIINILSPKGRSARSPVKVFQVIMSELLLYGPKTEDDLYELPEFLKNRISNSVVDGYLEKLYNKGLISRINYDGNVLYYFTQKGLKFNNHDRMISNFYCCSDKRARSSVTKRDCRKVYPISNLSVCSSVILSKIVKKYPYYLAIGSSDISVEGLSISVISKPNIRIFALSYVSDDANRLDKLYESLNRSFKALNVFDKLNTLIIGSFTRTQAEAVYKIVEKSWGEKLVSTKIILYSYVEDKYFEPDSLEEFTDFESYDESEIESEENITA